MPLPEPQEVKRQPLEIRRLPKNRPARQSHRPPFLRSRAQVPQKPVLNHAAIGPCSRAPSSGRIRGSRPACPAAVATCLQNLTLGSGGTESFRARLRFQVSVRSVFVSVRIRMKKIGRSHQSFFRICAIDKRSPRHGRVLEHLGTYDPRVQRHRRASPARRPIASTIG